MKIHQLAFLALFVLLFACNEPLEVYTSYPVKDSKQKTAGAESIVFRSTDDGQTWEDFSEGLPENMQGDGFFANRSGLYLRAGIEIYHRERNPTAASWKKQVFPDEPGSTAKGKTGIYAFNFDGLFLQNVYGRSAWAPKYGNLKVEEIRNVFETGGNVFISRNWGLFKSSNKGKTWKQVHDRGWVGGLVESNGVLLAASEKGILRSTDGGEKWDYVLTDGYGTAIEQIKGGVAVITYDTKSGTRRVRATYDGGNTWQSIDAGLPLSRSIWAMSIMQVGDYFFCSLSSGIYRTSDKGKTWKLMLPAIGKKVYNLSVSDNVLYVVPIVPGC